MTTIDGPWFHLVAHTRRGSERLLEHPVAEQIWSAMQRVFPLVAAAIIMRDHLHLLARAVAAIEAQMQLRALLSGVARSSAGRGIRFDPVPAPRLVPDRKQLGRQQRYIVLNPTRARLVDDPLRWPWSTHRDVMGAVVDPWVTPRTLAAALGEPIHGFARRHHQVVSADTTVDPAGTPAPAPAAASSVALVSFEHVVAAALAATRAAPERLRVRGPVRDLLVALAWHTGWRDRQLLAEVCGLTPRAIADGTDRVAPEALRAGMLCLGDARLRHGVRSAEVLSSLRREGASAA